MEEDNSLNFNDVANELCMMEGGSVKALNAAQAREALRCVCVILNRRINPQTSNREENVLDRVGDLVGFIERHGS